MNCNTGKLLIWDCTTVGPFPVVFPIVYFVSFVKGDNATTLVLSGVNSAIFEAFTQSIIPFIFAILESFDLPGITRPSPFGDSVGSGIGGSPGCATGCCPAWEEATDLYI